jgi:iron complex outermembrane receptor protein
MSRTRQSFLTPVAALVLGMLAPHAYLVAQATASRGNELPASQCINASHLRAATWHAPLDRALTLTTGPLTLRDALERVGKESGIQLSFSTDMLPNRSVCMAFDRTPVGAALEALLAGISMRAMVVGETQVVLAPVRANIASDSVGFARTSSVLDRVVVTGSPDGAPQRGTAFGLDVIDRATLVSHGVTALGQALELAVPGVWMWASSPGAMTAQYASIRGASSFGTSAPKIYLDGVEVANPLLVTQIDASRVERIEVIRGPQGAALYGADAISGVVNIITRLDGTPTGSPVVQLSSSAGFAETDFATRNAFVQNHALSVRAGSGPRSAGGGATFSNVGAYVPGASELRVLADANGRMLLTNGMVTGIARFSTQRANSVVSPLRVTVDDTIGAQAMSQYTLGATASLMPDTRWTVTAIAGVDGFRVNGLSNASLPVPMSLQDATHNSRGGADRLSLRLRGAARLAPAERTSLTFTIAAENAMLRDASGGTIVDNTIGNGPASRGRVLQSQWATNSGVVTQADLAWRDVLYLVAGGRLEQTIGATPLPQTAAMPMLGAAFVRDVGGATLKLRAGYGRGIRPAQTLLRGASWSGRAAAETMLSPESQAGTEFGTDLVWGNRVSLHVTRFDQRASGLIQPVAIEILPGIARPGMNTPDSARAPRIAYVLENVGAIDNRGWELEGNARWRTLSLIGWWSIVESRVATVSNAYRGDLRTGDRPLEVPRHTMSVSANWASGRFQAGVTLARASDWIAYDRVAIASALQSSERPTAEMTGSQLRRFWTGYEGVTRLRGTMSVRLAGQTSFQVGGENLLDIQRGAPDNATIVAGRTLTVGARTTF